MFDDLIKKKKVVFVPIKISKKDWGQKTLNKNKPVWDIKHKQTKDTWYAPFIYAPFIRKKL